MLKVILINLCFLMRNYGIHSASKEFRISMNDMEESILGEVIILTYDSRSSKIHHVCKKILQSMQYYACYLLDFGLTLWALFQFLRIFVTRAISRRSENAGL